MFGTGISRIGDMIDLAVAKNIIAKTGAWFAYKEERLGQGRENAKEFLEQNPTIAAKIEQEVLTAYNIKGDGDAADAKAAASKDSTKDSKADLPRAGAAAAGASPAPVAANGTTGAAKFVAKKPGAVAADK